MEILAPAKINLALDITGRRPDGYHTLQMVMQSISLYDRISVHETKTGKIEVICDDSNIPCGEENTVRRAAEAFFEQSGIPLKRGVMFKISKQIPEQAGLGGGSADAAAALKLLNMIYHTGLTPIQLQKIGLSVGADVPFCIRGGTMLAEGIGENLVPIKSLPLCHIVVCKPAAGISTKEAYAAFDSAGYALTDYTSKLLDALNTGSLSEIGESLGNVFESANIPQEVLEIEKAMNFNGSLGACMTGSGSAVFGLFNDFQKAKSCKEVLMKKYAKTFLCEPVLGDGQKSAEESQR